MHLALRLTDYANLALHVLRRVLFATKDEWYKDCEHWYFVKVERGLVTVLFSLRDNKLPTSGRLKSYSIDTQADKSMVLATDLL